VTELRLHSLVERSDANGPGTRAVLWVQGCTLGCPGCFNGDTHDAEIGDRAPVDALVERLTRLDGIEGVTVSGGEPFQQAAALHALVDGLRRRTSLSIVLFSGYRRAEIERLPMGPAILAASDVLLAGRYVASRWRAAVDRLWGGKEIHFLSARYGPADFESGPDAEVLIDDRGALRITGPLPPVALRAGS
jgi:anaerobic ribonucleoside-triphosphate reductase activating protein